MGVSKVDYAGTTLVDLTGDTVSSESLVEGYTATDASGEKITGTLGVATSEKDGLMAKEDKAKLDAIENVGTFTLDGTTLIITSTSTRFSLSGTTLTITSE